MRKLKIFLIFLSLIFLPGCFQSTALLGPSVTVFTTGNVMQAGFQYGANKAVKKETGKYPLTHIKESVESTNNSKELIVELKDFIEEKFKTIKKK